MLKPTQIVVFCDNEFCRVWYEKNMEFCNFGGNNLRNGASYALDQWRTLIGNRIQRIECCHLRAPVTTASARNLVQNPSNSAVSLAFNGSHVALSQHLLSFLLSFTWAQVGPWCCNNTVKRLLKSSRWNSLRHRPSPRLSSPLSTAANISNHAPSNCSMWRTS